MPDSFHSYEPHAGHGMAHDPFNAIVGPRPIGWISSCSAAGAVNLAPYSFFNAFNYVPPLIGFASIGYKDTLRNIEETGEFVWNLTTRPLAEAMNQTCAPVGPDVNEFALAGLAAMPSDLVQPPRVADSPVSLDCRKTQVLQLQGLNGQPVSTWLVLGEVVKVHIARHLIQDGVCQTAAAAPVLRGGGPADYFEISQDKLFRMWRPSR